MYNYFFQCSKKNNNVYIFFLFLFLRVYILYRWESVHLNSSPIRRRVYVNLSDWKYYCSDETYMPIVDFLFLTVLDILYIS